MTNTNTGYKNRKISLSSISSEDKEIFLPIGLVLPDEAYQNLYAYKHFLVLRWIMLHPSQDYIRQRKEAESFRLELLRYWITKKTRRGVSRQWDIPRLEAIQACLERGKLVNRDLIIKSLLAFNASRQVKYQLLRAYWRLKHKSRQ